MNIIILGAGEVGKQLTFTLSNKDNNIVVVDSSMKLLNRLKDKLDIMTVYGDCSNFNILKMAGISTCNILIATTGSDASNILACLVAKHYKVNKTVCRLSSQSYFSDEDYYNPSSLGIDNLIFPTDECVDRIIGVLDHNIVAERIIFKQTDAQITAVKIPRSSPVEGIKIHDFPNKELLPKIRFSALVRDQKVIIPHGSISFFTGDEVYVAGSKSSVNRFIDIVGPNSVSIDNVIIVGATNVGQILASKLVRIGYRVKLIEKDQKKGEKLLSELGERVMVIHGDPTESEVLFEAGIDACDAFISTSDDDEENILTCILAKKKGAGKVITITNKEEYVDIVPGIGAIDCGFSPRLVAVNSVLNLLGTETAKVHAILQRTSGYVYELYVTSSSPICGKKISHYEGFPSVILSLVFRDGKMMPATGDFVLKEGDQVAAVTTAQNIKQFESLFKKKRVFRI
ncbi:MAG TPA: Trk system potassium transporter TrkA [Victivallales bacterium]|nr:Trk system potassium transporter TrkA [Victivallales bacterium]